MLKCHIHKVFSRKEKLFVEDFLSRLIQSSRLQIFTFIKMVKDPFETQKGVLRKIQHFPEITFNNRRHQVEDEFYLIKTSRI